MSQHETQLNPAQPDPEKWWSDPVPEPEVHNAEPLDEWWVDFEGKRAEPQVSLEDRLRNLAELDLGGSAEVPTTEWYNWKHGIKLLSSVEPELGPEPVKIRQVSYEEIVHRAQGWKFHLNFDAENPVKVQSVQTALDKLQSMGAVSQFKIGHRGGKEDGQPGKEATVYVGHRDKANALAPIIEEMLDGVLESPDEDALGDDIPFTGRVIGRFDIGSVDPEFHQYGAKGHAILNEDMHSRTQRLVHYMQNPDEFDKQKEIDAAKADAVLNERYRHFYSGSKLISANRL